ncbi:SDR family NAD(P)-dependent oxidoreductase [Chloroflexota bacterium]
MSRLEGRTAIITGAAGAGIGQAVARTFAKEGAAVVVSDRHEGRTQEVARDLGAQGYRALGVVCDVTDYGQVEVMVKRTLDEFGRVDILVNNAGREIKVAPLHEMDDEVWDSTLAINLTGTFYCCRAVVPIMMEQKYGKIVNISSGIVWTGSGRGEVAYAAAKAGVIGLTRCLSMEMVAHGVYVNCVVPGLILNPFLSEIMPRLYDEGTLEEFLGEQPLGRAGTPQELANAVLFLASDEAGFITGDTLGVTGGRFLH